MATYAMQGQASVGDALVASRPRERTAFGNPPTGDHKGRPYEAVARAATAPT